MNETNGEIGFKAGRTFADMKKLVGEELGVSEWITVSQAMIDMFADCTGDRQWIHVDVERAARDSPFGAPVAHGYLTLSLLPVMSYQLGAGPEGVRTAVNYGLDRLRFVTPVRAGSRVRLRSRLVGFEEKEPGRFLMKSNQTVEIEGSEKPALVADALSLLVAVETSEQAA